MNIKLEFIDNSNIHFVLRAILDRIDFCLENDEEDMLLEILALKGVIEKITLRINWDEEDEDLKNHYNEVIANVEELEASLEI